MILLPALSALRLSTLICVVTTFFLGFAGQCVHADFFVTFQNGVQAGIGDTATMNVFLTSNSNQTFDAYQVQFVLTPLASSPNGGAVFSPTLNLQYLTDPNYVFHSRSGVVNTNNSSPNSTDGTTLTGFDFSDDGSSAPNSGNPFPYSMLANQPVLLFQLDLTGIALGTYQVSLDSSNTTFLDDQINFIPINFQNTPGVFTVTAVPEPSSLTIVGLAQCVVVLRRRRPVQFIG